MQISMNQGDWAIGAKLADGGMSPLCMKNDGSHL